MLPSGLPEHIADEESLARFLNSSSLFNAASRIKPTAFLPRKGEASVFRQDAENEEELWGIGESIIPPGRKVHGAALIQAEKVRESGLDVEAKEPPPKHANIVGWQAGDNAMTKARNKESALVLAQYATLKKKP